MRHSRRCNVATFPILFFMTVVCLRFATVDGILSVWYRATKTPPYWAHCTLTHMTDEFNTPVISLHLRFWNQFQRSPPPPLEGGGGGGLARRFESTTLLSRDVDHQLPSDAVPCPSRTRTSIAPPRKPRTHSLKEFWHQTCFPRVFVWPVINPCVEYWENFLAQCKMKMDPGESEWIMN
jgi:hypothetical protein